MEFRGLKAAELEAWFDHAATVFSTPRAHFVNHWHNDPWKDLEGIRVAVDGGRIASTVRVFMRRIHLGGARVAAGGIGEVSTLPEIQAAGVGDATVAGRGGIHAGTGHRHLVLVRRPGDLPRGGLERVPLYYARRQMGAKVDRAFRIRPADLGQDAELETLAALYDAYARRFNGTLVRGHRGYWGDWFPTESPRVWVAEAQGAIKAYLSLSANGRKEGLEVKEFAAGDEVFAHDGGKRAFEALIGKGIAAAGRVTQEVAFPAPIARGFEAGTVEGVGNLMYRVIDQSLLPPGFDGLGNLLHRQPPARDQGIKSHHVFWTTDGF